MHPVGPDIVQGTGRRVLAVEQSGGPVGQPLPEAGPLGIEGEDDVEPERVVVTLLGPGVSGGVDLVGPPPPAHLREFMDREGAAEDQARGRVVALRPQAGAAVHRLNGVGAVTLYPGEGPRLPPLEAVKVLMKKDIPLPAGGDAGEEQAGQKRRTLLRRIPPVPCLTPSRCLPSPHPRPAQRSPLSLSTGW